MFGVPPYFTAVAFSIVIDPVTFRAVSQKIYFNNVAFRKQKTDVGDVASF